MVTDRVRQILAEIADDRSEDGEPFIHAWHDLRIGHDDAKDLCTCIALADAVEHYHAQYGQEKGDRLLKTLIKLMGTPATVETLQMMERTEVKS